MVCLGGGWLRLSGHPGVSSERHASKKPGAGALPEGPAVGDYRRDRPSALWGLLRAFAPFTGLGGLLRGSQGTSYPLAPLRSGAPASRSYSITSRGVLTRWARLGGSRSAQEPVFFAAAGPRAIVATVSAVTTSSTMRRLKSHFTFFLQVNLPLVFLRRACFAPGNPFSPPAQQPLWCGPERHSRRPPTHRASEEPGRPDRSGPSGRAWR